jgi:glyoxylase I family protein
MPQLSVMTGNHVNLSVSDLERSVAWYTEVFELVVVGDERSITPFSAEPMRYRSLGSLETMSYVIGLIEHERRSSEQFDEHRTGLDHVGLHVPDASDLEAWMEHLDALGVEHSEIKVAPYASSMTLRDPDGIQLELFWVDLGYWAGLFVDAAARLRQP